MHAWSLWVHSRWNYKAWTLVHSQKSSNLGIVKHDGSTLCILNREFFNLNGVYPFSAKKFSASCSWATCNSYGCKKLIKLQIDTLTAQWPQIECGLIQVKLSLQIDIQVSIGPQQILVKVWTPKACWKGHWFQIECKDLWKTLKVGLTSAWEWKTGYLRLWLSSRGKRDQWNCKWRGLIRRSWTKKTKNHWWRWKRFDLARKKEAKT